MRKLEMHELERLETEAYSTSQKFPLVVVLDNVRSFNNVGSVFRTADCFGVSEILLCGITPVPPHREIHKTALGAEDSVPWKHISETTDALKSLSESGYIILAVEQVMPRFFLTDFQPEKHKKYAFVFGNEVDGVSDEALAYCHGSLEIPQFGSKHSLNISVSAGVVVWDIVQKFMRL